MDVHEPKHDERIAETREPNDTALGELTEEVWVLSGSSMYAAEPVVDTLQGSRSGEATTSRRSSRFRDDTPNYVQMGGGKEPSTGTFFFFSSAGPLFFEVGVGVTHLSN